MTEKFEARCKKLPGKLRDWEAYITLKKEIEDFTIVLPLITELTKDSIKPRHWTAVMDITNTTFEVDTEDFKVRSGHDSGHVEREREESTRYCVPVCGVPMRCFVSIRVCCCGPTVGCCMPCTIAHMDVVVFLSFLFSLPFLSFLFFAAFLFFLFFVAFFFFLFFLFFAAFLFFLFFTSPPYSSPSSSPSSC